MEKDGQMICPFCKSEMQGKEDSKMCINLGCGAYQINKDNYDLPRKRGMN